MDWQFTYRQLKDHHALGWAERALHQGDPCRTLWAKKNRPKNTANRTYVFPDASGNVALLNIPQTWTAEQTLISPELRNPEIGGEVLGAVPRSVFTAFLPGPLTTAYTAASFTPDKAIVLTGIEVTPKTLPTGCATNATVRVSGSVDTDLEVSGQSNSSGPLSLTTPANTPLQIKLQIPALGCATFPRDANVTVAYKMQ